LKKQLKKTDVDLSKIDDAYILIARNFLPEKNANRLLRKQLAMYKWDRKYYDTRRKSVLNKHARANITHQEPVYEVGKGTDVPELKKLRNKIGQVVGAKGKDLICEGNWYDDKNKNGMEMLKESRLLQATMPIVFNWFYQCVPIGEKFKSW